MVAIVNVGQDGVAGRGRTKRLLALWCWLVVDGRQGE